MGVESKKEGALGKTIEGAREMNNWGTREFLKYLGNVYIRVSYNWAFFFLMKTIKWAHAVQAQIGPNKPDITTKPRIHNHPYLSDFRSF